MRAFPTFCILSIAVMLASGCSGSRGPVDPAKPDPVRDPVSAHSDRILLGLWEVRVAEDHKSAEVSLLRGAQMHLNIVRLLEIAPCTDCLSIGNLQPVPHKPMQLTADLTLRHPYANLLKLTAFDVRGIFIAGSDYTFASSGRKVAWGDTVPRLMNPDGYTFLFNPTEFPESNPGPPWQKYIPGKFAPGGDLNATLNPFVSYATEVPRRMFESGAQESRMVHLRLPAGPLEFGYAVDASWVDVDGPVTDPLVDFPPEANCSEAYKVDVPYVDDLMPGVGSSAPINVTVRDHQGLDTISTVTVEAPALFNGLVELDFSQETGDESYLFTGTVANVLGAPLGHYPMLVRVIDTQSDPNLGSVDAWMLTDVQVGKYGWAQSWGGLWEDSSEGIAVDDSGNIYVAGNFKCTVDFDPGPGIDEHGWFCTWPTGASWSGNSLVKYDPDGNYIWGAAWYDEPLGTWNSKTAYGVAVSDFGDVYVLGYYWGGADFDPNADPDDELYLVESNGETDVYLTKFDSNGNWQWAGAWGGIDYDEGNGLLVNSAGDVSVSGRFRGTVDFDPGPGVVERTSQPTDSSAFLSRFNSNGDFLWVKTWDASRGHMMASDAAENIYVSGSFQGKVDFDPGPGVEMRTSNGQYDASLSKLTPQGDLIWVRTWGGLAYDECYDVAVNSLGSVYATGYYRSMVDFDPGSGAEIHTAIGLEDVYLSKFNSAGDFKWARVWGSGTLEIGFEVLTNESDEAYVAGTFTTTVDFDPDEHEEWRTPDYISIFLSKFKGSGEFQLVQTWSANYAYGLEWDPWGNLVLAGSFANPVDFDPGPGVEMHDTHGLSDAYLLKTDPNGMW